MKIKQHIFYPLLKRKFQRKLECILNEKEDTTLSIFVGVVHLKQCLVENLWYWVLILGNKILKSQINKLKQLDIEEQIQPKVSRKKK